MPGDEDAVDMAFDAVRNHLGRGRSVNDVCIAGPTAAAEVRLADWNESLRVIVTSHFLFARRAIPLMKAQRRGFILNISSGSAKVGLPLRLPYIVSKGAVLSLTMNLARAWPVRHPCQRDSAWTYSCPSRRASDRKQSPGSWNGAK